MRLFLIRWDPASYGDPTASLVQTRGLSFFVPRNGFDDDDLERVARLLPGGSATLDDGAVQVTRLADGVGT